MEVSDKMNSSSGEEPLSHKDVKWDDIPHFVNADNQRIFCRYWTPAEESKIRAIVFIVHGVAEHSRWYAPIAEMLVKEGLLVCSHDQIGHGLSEGDRVHITAFSQYTRDLLQHVNKIKEKHTDLPIYLLGHSMGGTVVVQSGLDNPDLYKGIVMIGPAIVSNPEFATPVKIAMAKFAAWILPQLQVGKMDKSWMSRDKDVQKAYEDDPLIWHGGLKARWAVCLLDTLNSIQSRMGEIKWPFLVIHGTVDKLCELSGSEMLYQLASSKDKALKVYEGAYHQVQSEPDGQGEQCKQEIVDWITSRIDTQG